jgi:hypothetical protein
MSIGSALPVFLYVQVSNPVEACPGVARPVVDDAAPASVDGDCRWNARSTRSPSRNARHGAEVAAAYTALTRLQAVSSGPCAPEDERRG